jgi:hypothetical protein
VSQVDRARPRAVRRWVCDCQQPPVLLATVDPDGTLNVKVGDRYYHIEGVRRMRATCPRCGRVHTLEAPPVTPEEPAS